MTIGETLRRNAIAAPGDDGAFAVYLDWLIESHGWVHLGSNAAGATECRLPRGPVVIWIPSGSFWRGSRRDDVDAYGDEWPRERIALDAFWIGRAPVTWGEYRDWCTTEGKTPPSQPRGADASHPVVNVNWTDAQRFAGRMGCRLPTGDEWEKAARGVGGREFPWGHVFDPALCNSAASGLDCTTPVGSYPQGASPFGCLDMAGNVCEWCDDWLESRRVVRGGSYHDVARHLRCANRSRRAPKRRDLLTGFRVAV